MVRHGAFPSHHALLVVVVVIQVVGAAWPPQPPLAYASCALAVRGSYFERSFRVEHYSQNLKILSKKQFHLSIIKVVTTVPLFF